MPKVTYVLEDQELQLQLIIFKEEYAVEENTVLKELNMKKNVLSELIIQLKGRNLYQIVSNVLQVSFATREVFQTSILFVLKDFIVRILKDLKFKLDAQLALFVRRVVFNQQNAQQVPTNLICINLLVLIAQLDSIVELQD